MRKLAIAAINIYQKFISPYKGYRCAHAALHQGDSCSNAIKKIIERHGIFSGYIKIKARFSRCRKAYLQLVETEEKNKDKKKDKGNWYDCCDPSAACDIASCTKKKSCDAPELPCDCSLF